MNRLVAVARNIRFVVVEHDGTMTLESEIEAVLTVIEKVEKQTGDKLVSAMETHTHRFTLSVEATAMLVQHMTEWMHEAEKLLKDVQAK